MTELLQIYKLCVSMIAVGSRVTCFPAPMDTDCDWLVMLSKEQVEAFENEMNVGGWALGGSDIPDASNLTPEADRFHSYTLREQNLIVTTSEVFHRRFLAATSVSKRLNLLIKDDRIALFQAVLYGNEDPANPTWTPADSFGDLFQ